jgi:hypothetical protein
MTTTSSPKRRSTGTKDMLFLLMMSFFFMFVVILPFLAEDDNKKDERKGNVMVDLFWDDKSTSDVDLWVRGPDMIPIGYSNKTGPYFTLMRDDLGRRADISGVNQETTISYGYAPGAYAVNVHLYRNHDHVLPITGRIIVYIKENPAASAKQILFANFTLTRAGQELTVFQFEMNEDRRLVHGSVTTAPVKLRSSHTDG